MKGSKVAIVLALLAVLIIIPIYGVKAEDLLWMSDVPSNGTPVTSPVLLLGVTYRIRVTGTWFDAYYPSEDLTQTNFADAQYYTTPPYDTTPGNAYYWIWDQFFQPDSHSFLQIDGQDVNWGPFSNGGWDSVIGWFGHEYEIYYTGQGKSITFNIYDWIDGNYCNNMCHLVVEIYGPEVRFPKQFTSAFAFGGFEAPNIVDDGLKTTVVGLHSGPRISWNITYYFANTAEFLGSQYDGQAHYFRLWDKWGGNLMALNSTPIAFNTESNIVTLVDGTMFKINYAGYAAYIGNGLTFTDSRGGSATITLKTGNQQAGTNPGKGKGTKNDGASYDVDLVWNIGYLELGQSATLKIVIAPGKNPAGVLMFSSPGFEWINTGPRARVYADEGFTDFLYAVEKTVQLGVTVKV